MTKNVNTSSFLEARPVVVVSKCLGFDACRWNGVRLDDPFVEMLQPFVEFRTVCPECEIGLGVPRRPIRMVRGETPGAVRLVQPATGRDITTEMDGFVRSFLDTCGDVDGFVLKHKSPSCGLNNVNVYHGADKEGVERRRGGFFGETVKERFPRLPAEDEGRLHNFLIREHWLTWLYAGARLRRVEAAGSMGMLVEFHAAHKYLLMAMSQATLKRLGKMVANHDKAPIEHVLREYGEGFRQALAQPVKPGPRINVLEHLLGHFSDKIEPRERAYFLDLLEEFRRGGLPMSAPLSVIKGWAIRFEDEYVLQQTFLSPFPDALVTVTDSGKGRKL